MVIFLPSSNHIATVAIMVNPSGLSCQVEVWLGLSQTGTKVATSGVKSFNSTGNAQNVSCPVTMPDASKAGIAYNVYIDIYVAGSLAATYVGSDQIAVVNIGTPVVTWS